MVQGGFRCRASTRACCAGVVGVRLCAFVTVEEGPAPPWWCLDRPRTIGWPIVEQVWGGYGRPGLAPSTSTYRMYDVWPLDLLGPDVELRRNDTRAGV